MGPTGAGKSAIALGIAATRPTVIINADAMQMVGTLRVLTARPTEQEETHAEHALYGVLAANEPTSVAVWLSMVAPVIRAAWDAGKLPLLVGGTGMYIKALMEGLATIPPIPEEIRARVRSLIPPHSGGRLGGGLMEPESDNQPPPLPSPGGGGSIYTLLQQRDPPMASRLKPGDTQRILRALEVMEATGISLMDWQNQASAPLFPAATYHCFAAMHPRSEIYARIDARFEAMVQNGALEEVRALMALDLSPEIPIMRAHGVPELMAHLRSEMTLNDAIAKGQQNTRNYAKRQMTWLRNQLPDVVEVKDAGEIVVALPYL